MRTEKLHRGLAAVLGVCLSLVVSTNVLGDDETIAPAGDGLIMAPDRPHADDASRRPVGPLEGRSAGDISDMLSEQNRRACREWCDTEEECSKCMPSGICGTGYVVLRTWGSGSTAWDACKHVASVSMPDTGPPSRPKLPERTPVPPIRK